jgi:DNA primase
MPGLLSQNVLEQIRAASDIVEIIGGYLPLKRAGGNFVALCPFHKEKSPSFHVNPQRQIFHCFGCHKGGDVFTFLREYEGLSFMDAVRRLAERAHIMLDFDGQPEQQQARALKDQLLEMHEQIAQRWQTALANDAAGQVARDYLAKRGVSAEAVQLFRLGYAPEAWDDTVNWARSKKFDLAMVEQAGLILHSDTANKHYDRFRGRLMFPICDEQGRVVAFSGRVLVPDEKSAKYVNSPETPIFHKGRIFYGLDKSKRPILDKGFVVICEGQLDLIACYMAGVRNIVAPQGTAFTSDHARMLRRYVNEVVLCFDADEAGQKAAVRVLDSLLAVGMAIRVASIPSPHDPDSFIKEFGGAAFAERIEKAEGFFDFYLKHLCARHNPASDKGRLDVLRAMGEALHKANNRVLLDTYAQKTALSLGVAPESVMTEFRHTTAPRTSAEEHEDEGVGVERAAPPPLPERRLLRILLTRDEVVGWLAAHLDLHWIQHETARRIFALRLAAHHSQNWQGLSPFLTEIEEDELRSLITEILAEPDPVSLREEARMTDADKMARLEMECRDLLLAHRNQHIQRQLTQLKQRLADSQLTVAEHDALFVEHQQLVAQKRLPMP